MDDTSNESTITNGGEQQLDELQHLTAQQTPDKHTNSQNVMQNKMKSRDFTASAAQIHAIHQTKRDEEINKLRTQFAEIQQQIKETAIQTTSIPEVIDLS